MDDGVPAEPAVDIGDPNTITSRTVLYVTMIAISGAAAAAAYRLRKVYARRWSSDVATGVAIASYIAIVVVAELILPSVDETLKGFPADTLWRFREASIGIPVPSYGRPSASDSARSRRGCLRASRSSRTGSASTKRHGPDAEAHDHHQREPSDTRPPPPRRCVAVSIAFDLAVAERLVDRAVAHQSDVRKNDPRRDFTQVNCARTACAHLRVHHTRRSATMATRTGKGER